MRTMFQQTGIQWQQASALQNSRYSLKVGTSCRESVRRDIDSMAPVGNSADTPLSLLERVQAGDAVAWNEFHARCQRLLTAWAVRWGLQTADADDLIQDTLLVVTARIRDFRRRGTGSFRLWIRTIAWHCLCDAMSMARRHGISTTLDRIRNTPDARQTLEEELDRLFELQVLEDAMQRVQLKVAQTTWAAFALTAVEGRSVQEVAEQLQVSVDAVYAARGRVQRFISMEIRRMANQG